MMPVLTSAQMREADRRTIEEIGLPGPVLMENAGAAVARAVRGHARPGAGLVILCGRGNNGGDGFVVARHLRDLSPLTVLFGARRDVSGEARVHLGVLERSGGTVVEALDEPAWLALRPRVADAGLVVDALLGTGLRQEPTGLMARVLLDLRDLRRDRGLFVVAVDIASGLSSDSGEAAWPTVEADLTVAFGAAKYGHVLPPASTRTGVLQVADIGIPAAVLRDAGAQLFLLERQDVAAAFVSREAAAHKGDFGHVLVIGGALGKTGAAILAANGALRAGAGLVTVATVAESLPIIAQARSELMTEALPLDDGRWGASAVARAAALAATRDAVVLGPGLGQEADQRAFVRALIRRIEKPLVVDADGLNALAAAPRIPAASDLLRRTAPTIVTPHPGEMGRLVGASTLEVQRRRLETARTFAVETGAVVVLKGHRTVVARGDGVSAVNPTGNPGMATGGTGDVLAGMLGALLARGAEAWLAACAGVFVHGAAGDRAALLWGEESMMAGDVVDALSDTLRDLLGPRPPQAGGGHA